MVAKDGDKVIGFVIKKYRRKGVADKLTSTYVDVYSDELYQLLLRNAKERKDLNMVFRKINKELMSSGYEDKELSARVLQNLDFARANMKASIYDQAVLEEFWGEMISLEEC